MWFAPSWGVCVGMTFGVALLAGSALADIPQPEEVPCHAMAVGDPCTYDPGNSAVIDGACANDTCTRLVYDPDGGAPTSTTYDCLTCQDDGLDPPPAAEGDDDGGCAAGGRGSTEAGVGGFALVACVLGWSRLRKRRQP